MKLLYYLKVITNNISRDIKKYLLVIFSIVITTVLISLTLYMMHIDEYDEKLAEKCLDCNIKNVGYINLEFEYTDDDELDIDKFKENQDKVLSEINLINGIDNLFYYSDNIGLWSENSCFDTIIYKQHELNKNNKNRKEDMPNEAVNTVDAVLIDENVFDIFSIQLLEGEVKKSKDGYNYIYLGYDLKDLYSVGDIIIDSHENKYEVAGIINNETYIIDEGLFLRNVQPVDPIVCLDTMILVDRPMRIYSNMFYIEIEDNYDFTYVINEIIEVCDKYHVVVTYDNLKKVLDHNASYYDDTVEALKKLIVIIFAVTFIMQLCIQFVITKKNSDTYVILNCNGFSMKDIIFINIIDSILKMILSLIITFGLSMLWVNYERDTIFSRKVGRDILITECITRCFAVILIIMILINIYTYVLINVNSKNELLGADRK